MVLLSRLQDKGKVVNIIPTIQILCIGTDRSQQTVHTKNRLLLKKQSDQVLHCLPFHPLNFRYFIIGYMHLVLKYCQILKTL